MVWGFNFQYAVSPAFLQNNSHANLLLGNLRGCFSTRCNLCGRELWFKLRHSSQVVYIILLPAKVSS